MRNYNVFLEGILKTIDGIFLFFFTEKIKFVQELIPYRLTTFQNTLQSFQRFLLAAKA